MLERGSHTDVTSFFLLLLQGSNLTTKDELPRYNATLESIDDFLKETEADEMNLSNDDDCISNNEYDD